MNSTARLLFSFILFITVGLIDQMSKQYILHHAKTKYYVNAMLAFTPPTFNRGIAGGMLHTHDGIGFLALSILIMLIVAGFAVYTYRRWSTGCSIIGETLVLSGALSNVLDRILYHGVVDFILLHHAKWSFPIFNVADAAITLGVFIMFFGALRPSK